MYKIIEFSSFMAKSSILSIWFSVLVKEYELTLHSIFLNCAFNDKKILSNVSPVESEIKKIW